MIMTEQMKQALVKETERHIAHDILYDDVYVGPFTEKDGVDCAIHAVDWYRNNCGIRPVKNQLVLMMQAVIFSL